MGTLTITTTAPQDVRIIKAFGARLGLGRDATGPEVKANIVQFIKDVVHQMEQQEAVTTAAVGVTPMDLTPE